MYTIKHTRYVFATPVIRYVGTFTDETSAGRAAVNMLDSGLFDGVDLDTIEIPDGVTPGYLSPDYLT